MGFHTRLQLSAIPAFSLFPIGKMTGKALFLCGSHADLLMVPYCPSLTCARGLVFSGIQKGSEILDRIPFIPDKIFYTEFVTHNLHKLF